MKLIRRAGLSALTLLMLYCALVVAHAYVPHKCPRNPHGQCSRHKGGNAIKGAAKTHFDDMDPDPSVPGACICPVLCFLSGDGLPIDN